MKNLLFVCPFALAGMALISGCSGNAAEEGAVENLMPMPALTINNLYGLAVDEQGKVWQWKTIASGEPSNLQQLPDELSDIAACTMFENTGLAMKKNGEIIAWDMSNPVEFKEYKETKDVIKITSSASHTLMLTEKGKVLGYGYRTLPDMFNILELEEPVKDIATGEWYSLVVKEDGTVWGCGKSTRGQLTVLGEQSVKLMKIEGLTDIVEIQAIELDNNLALDKHGNVYFWGSTTGGEIRKVRDDGEIQHITGSYFKKKDGNTGMIVFELDPSKRGSGKGYADGTGYYYNFATKPDSILYEVKAGSTGGNFKIDKHGKVSYRDRYSSDYLPLKEFTVSVSY